MLLALTSACSSAGPPANQPRDTSESVDSNTAPTKRVVGYLPNYRGPLEDWTQTLDFSALTHVTLAFASVDTEACGVSIHYRQKEATSGDEPGLAEFVAKAHSSGTKVCLAVAGGGKASDDFGELILKGPTELATKVAEYARVHDLDCIDVDQEENYPSAELDAAYGTFIRKLSSELHGMQKQLSAALANWNPNKVLPVLGEFDFLSVMAYDYGPPDRSTTPIQGSSISDSQAGLSWWVSQGAEPAKLLWGVPFYGYQWKGDGSDKDIGVAIPYRGIVEQLGSAPAGDEVRIGTSTITLNSSATIRRKAELAKASYGGIMMWELWQDTPGAESQLQVVKDVMRQ